MPKTVAVDFDNTLHPYSRGWVGVVPDDEPPIDGAEEFLHALLERGYNVVIHTTRADTPEGVVGTLGWFREHMPSIATLILKETITISAEKPKAIAYVDDRAVVFTGNYDVCLHNIAVLDERGPWGGHRANK